jgi:Tfp pilus assembly protein PilV
MLDLPGSVWVLVVVGVLGIPALHVLSLRRLRSASSRVLVRRPATVG